jgi:hypothetical protein
MPRPSDATADFDRMCAQVQSERELPIIFGEGPHCLNQVACKAEVDGLDHSCFAARVA